MANNNNDNSAPEFADTPSFFSSNKDFFLSATANEYRGAGVLPYTINNAGIFSSLIASDWKIYPNFTFTYNSFVYI